MRKTTLTLSVSLGATLAVSLALWNELREERERVADLSARLSATRNPATPAPAVPTSPVSPPNPAPVVMAPAPVDTSQAPHKVTGTEEEWQEAKRRLLRDPKYRAARADEMRLQYAAMRDEAVRLLGFTAAEADAVIEMLVERQMRSREQPDNTVVDASPEGLQRLKAKNQAAELAWQQQVRDRVGAQKQESWQTYMDSMGSRSRVNQLRVQLTGADALRDDQIEPLVAALHAERAKLREEIEQVGESMMWQTHAENSQVQYHQKKIDAMKAAHGRMHAAAAAILTDRQLDRLNAQMRLELERQETEQRLANAVRKAEAGAAKPNPD